MCLRGFPFASVPLPAPRIDLDSIPVGSHGPPGFYKLFNGPSDEGEIVDLRDSLAYKLDYLGLKVHQARVGPGGSKACRRK